MAYYRLYLLDGGGSIHRFVDGEFATDEAAIKRACEIDHDHGVAVWQEARLVSEITPTDTEH